MNTQHKPAVGYVRCSTEQQEDSPEQQKHEISAFAEKNGYSILEWFVDFGKSGTTFEQRPEFQHLRSEVESDPDFKVVICYDESRWGRAIDAEENTYWRVHFRKHGVDVVLVKTSVDRKSAFAPMLSALEGVQASQYSKKLSELTLLGAKRNGRFSNGGTAPYGYQRLAINLKSESTRLLSDGEWCNSGQEKVMWIPGDKSEIQVVHSIFEDRATGAGYGPIAERLNKAGISCPARGRWKNRDQKWSAGTVKSILNNPAYYGARVYNRNSMSKIRAEQEGWDARIGVSYPHWKQSSDQWVIVEQAHDPIVSKELWMKANDVNRPTKPPTSRVKAPYLLSQLIVCQKCGFHFQGQSTGAKGRSYPRYICGGFNSKGVCDFVAIRRDPLETYVAACVGETLARPDYVARIQRHMEQLLGSGSDSTEQREKIEQAMAEVDRRLENIARAIEDGGDVKLFRARIDDLNGQRTALEQRLVRLRVEELKEEKIEDLIVRVRDFKERFERTFNTAPLHERKQLMRMSVARIEVHHEPRMVRCLVRQVPMVDEGVEKLLQGRQKKLQAVRVSGPPVVTAGVAGAGLEPATFGL